MKNEQKIEEQIKATLAKYRQMQPIRDELDDAIDRIVAEYEALNGILKSMEQTNAALIKKLTEQDKLLEVMDLQLNSIIHIIRNQKPDVTINYKDKTATLHDDGMMRIYRKTEDLLAQYATYKAGRE
jgi:hypothetical protein